MTTLRRTSWPRSLTLPRVLLIVVVANLVLATSYVAVHTDVDVYRDYAAAVARGIDEGTSWADARDRILRDEARGAGRPPPPAEKLIVEYPPLAVAWMAAAGIGLDLDAPPSSDGGAYLGRYRLLMLAVELLMILVLVGWAARSMLPSGEHRLDAWRLAVFGSAGLILGNLLFDRLDLVVAALVLISLVLLVRGHWLVSFLVLAVAINFKAIPIALAPLWVLAALPANLVVQARARPVPVIGAIGWRFIVLVGLTVVAFLPFVIMEGARAVDFLRIRGDQGIEIESVPGTILLVLHVLGMPLEVTSRYATFELRSVPSAGLAEASPVIMVVGVLVTAVLYLRAARMRIGWRGSVPSPADLRPSLAEGDPRLILVATVTTLLVTLVTTKLLSPQYLIWLLPLVPLIDIGERRTRVFQVLFIVTCVLSTVIFPYLLGRTLARADPASDGYLDPTLLGIALVAARNVLLVWLTWLAVRAMWRPNWIVDPPRAGKALLSPVVESPT